MKAVLVNTDSMSTLLVTSVVTTTKLAAFHRRIKESGQLSGTILVDQVDVNTFSRKGSTYYKSDLEIQISKDGDVSIVDQFDTHRIGLIEYELWDGHIVKANLIKTPSKVVSYSHDDIAGFVDGAIDNGHLAPTSINLINSLVFDFHDIVVTDCGHGVLITGFTTAATGEVMKRLQMMEEMNSYEIKLDAHHIGCRSVMLPTFSDDIGGIQDAAQCTILSDGTVLINDEKVANLKNGVLTLAKSNPFCLDVFVGKTLTGEDLNVEFVQKTIALLKY